MAEVKVLAAGSVSDAFASPTLWVKGGSVRISPFDDRRQAGELLVQAETHGPLPQISGEVGGHGQVQQRISVRDQTIGGADIGPGS